MNFNKLFERKVKQRRNQKCLETQLRYLYRDIEIIGTTAFLDKPWGSQHEFPLSASSRSQSHHAESKASQLDIWPFLAPKTNIAGWNGWTRIEDVFPIENGDIPASYLSLLEGNNVP